MRPPAPHYHRFPCPLCGHPLRVWTTYTGTRDTIYTDIRIGPVRRHLRTHTRPTLRAAYRTRQLARRRRRARR